MDGCKNPATDNIRPLHWTLFKPLPASHLHIMWYRLWVHLRDTIRFVLLIYCPKKAGKLLALTKSLYYDNFPKMEVICPKVIMGEWLSQLSPIAPVAFSCSAMHSPVVGFCHLPSDSCSVLGGPAIGPLSPTVGPISGWLPDLLLSPWFLTPDWFLLTSLPPLTLYT